tara:strand:- start:7051 stop:7194 length:144 start_codon:yes stop_codon:yes gene_type:complete
MKNYILVLIGFIIGGVCILNSFPPYDVYGCAIAGTLIGIGLGRLNII